MDCRKAFVQNESFLDQIDQKSLLAYWKQLAKPVERRRFSEPCDFFTSDSLAVEELSKCISLAVGGLGMKVN